MPVTQWPLVAPQRNLPGSFPFPPFRPGDGSGNPGLAIPTEDPTSVLANSAIPPGRISPASFPVLSNRGVADVKKVYLVGASAGVATDTATVRIHRRVVGASAGVATDTGTLTVRTASDGIDWGGSPGAYPSTFHHELVQKPKKRPSLVRKSIAIAATSGGKSTATGSIATRNPEAADLEALLLLNAL